MKATNIKLISFPRLMTCLTLLALTVVLVRIAASPRPSWAQPKEGETNKLVVCIPIWAEPLDPTDHRSSVVPIVLKTMFDSLTTRESTTKVVPQLAESWRIITDTNWEFTLKKGVKFHNGDELTADDVKFTLDLVTRKGALNGRTSPRRGLFKPISKTMVAVRYKVRIETSKPWPVLPLMLSLQEIVPRKYMSEVGVENSRQQPVGTGPFTFLKMEGKERLVQERFDGFYGGSLRPPPVGPAGLKRLVFRTVPSKAEQVALLKAGECDIVPDLSPEPVPMIQSTPSLKGLKSTATISYCADINRGKPPRNDRRIRQALKLLVDRRALVRNIRHILKGHGFALPTVLLPNAFSHGTALKPYPYKPVMAEALLGKNAGWDINVGRWGNSPLDPIGILPAKLKTGARGSYSGYNNPEFDQLLSSAEKTLDRNTRKTDYEKIQKSIYRDALMIFGYAPDELYGVNKRVKNFKTSPRAA